MFLLPLSLQLSKLNLQLREEILLQYLSVIVSPSLVIWLAFLWLLGVFLKHCTPFPNWCISIAILFAGMLLGFLYGLAHPSYEILAYVCQGIVLALFAIGSYDMAHGVFKGIKIPKESKETMKVKAFFKELENLWLSLAVVGCSTIVTILASLIIDGYQGIYAILDAGTIAILISVFVLTINDVAGKLEDKKYKICWQYWTFIASVIAMDIAFAYAWKRETFGMMFISLGITTALAITSMIIYLLLYKPAVSEKEAIMGQVMKLYLERHNVPAMASTLLFSPDKEEIKHILEELVPPKEKKVKKNKKEEE